MVTATPIPPAKAARHPAAAGGDVSAQLAMLKAHLRFQNQESYETVRIDWCTVITKEQSRRDTTRDLHRKINAKAPGAAAAGKLDSPDGQEALQTAARLLKQGLLHGGNGFYLIGWNLRYRIYRSCGRGRALAESGFWEMLAETGNSPKLRPKEDEFPENVRHRHAEHRRARALAVAQGARPKAHPDAVIILTDQCPGCGTDYLAEEVNASPGLRCPQCQHSFRGQTPTEKAFIPGEPPTLITAETPPLRRRSVTR